MAEKIQNFIPMIHKDTKTMSSIVYITRYALSKKGIILANVVQIGEDGYVKVEPNPLFGITVNFNKKDYALDFGTAKEQAEAKRKRRVSSKQKELAKLQDMSFDVVYDVDGKPVSIESLSEKRVAFVTKYFQSKGIIVAPAIEFKSYRTLRSYREWVTVEWPGRLNNMDHFYGNDYAETWSDAQHQAEIKRDRKIESVKKTLDRLQKLTFSDPLHN